MKANVDAPRSAVDAAKFLQAQAAEHARLSKLLHDDFGQALSAVGLHLDVLHLDLEQQVPDIRVRTSSIQHILENLVERVRDLSYELNPNIAERIGLASALDRLTGRFRREFPGKIRLHCDSTARVPAPVASVMYQIAQQALDNAVMHSGAAQIVVSLKNRAKGVTLEVNDNGRGFLRNSDETSRNGLGIILIEHLAAGAGLVLQLQSTPGIGTFVRVRTDKVGA